MGAPPGKAHTFIRFQGGCGGETLWATMNEAINGVPTPISNHGHNRTMGMDFYSDAFQVSEVRHQVGESFSHRLWQYIPVEEVQAFVRKRLENSGLAHPIGKGHYPFPFTHFRRIFGDDAFFIDVVPSKDALIITKGLQFVKAHLVRAYEPYPHANVDPALQKQIDDHVADHGWYPNYWKRVVPNKIPSFDIGVFVQANMSADRRITDDPNWQKHSDLPIRGEDLITDPSLTSFDRILALYGVLLNNEQRARVSRWVQGNNDLLATTGLQRLIGAGLSFDQQTNILTNFARTRLATLYE